MRLLPCPQWKDEGTYKEPTDNDNIRVPRLEIDNATTYIDKDGSNNMTFTDAVSGTQTLAQLLAGGGAGDMTVAVYDPAAIAEQLVGLVAAQTLANKTLGSDAVANSTNAITDALSIIAGAGTNNEAAGQGVGVTFKIGNAASEVEERASLDVALVVATNGDEDVQVILNTMHDGVMVVPLIIHPDRLILGASVDEIRRDVNNGTLTLFGGLTELNNSSAGLVLYGGDDVTYPGGLLWQTTDATQNAANRLIMTGSVATSVATWSNITHTGLKLSGDLDANTSYQITNLQAPAANGEAIRQTAKITEAKLEALDDLTLAAHAARHLVSGLDTIFPADPGADRYLMWDDDPGALVWASPAGGGDVTGPAASVDNAIVRFDGVTGKVVQDYTSGAPTISDTGQITMVDDILFAYGTHNDIVTLNRSTALLANTALAGVFVGTPIVPALAANSHIIANTTADGDILIAGNDGGNSRTVLFFDASAPDTILYNVGGTWSAGATAWTIPPFTVSAGNVTMTGAGTVDGIDISAHDVATTGVHGVGAGTIAKTADITATKLDDFATPDANTDLNANTTNHGLLLQATAPAAGLYNYVGITNGETAYTNKALFDATAPTDSDAVSAGAVGTAAVAARRDHVHKLDAAIADDAVLTVDDASAADDDFAIFTAAGIEGITAQTALSTLLAQVLLENDAIKLDPALSADGKWNGITVTGTAGVALAFGDIVYFAVADSRWELAKADAAATSFGKIGICVLAAAGDGSATNILLWGTVRADTAFPALTVGAPVFISAATAGDITSTAPTGTTNFVVRIVGYGNTADELFFCPDNTYVELA